MSRSVTLMLVLELAVAPLSALSEASSAELQFLTDATRRLLSGCRVQAADGTWLYTPDGKGNYRALWTRDFAYMVENAGDLLPVEDVEGCLRFLIRGVRDDGAAPDRVRPGGAPVYRAGPEDRPLGEPNIDNAQFLVIAVDAHLQRLPRKRSGRLFAEWSPRLDRAMAYIPRAACGLVWNDPARPHSPYGFTDTVGKTGELLFESLLYWTASQRMETWHRRTGDAAAARDYARHARQIEANLARLWDDEHGALLAATVDCRQLDVWGNAYAIWLDLPLGAKRARILRFLRERQVEFVWRGQVRHLVRGEHWQRLLTPVQPERYQNGAYWATASGWLMYALSRTDRQGARRVWEELIRDFRNQGICECVNEGYRQLDSYVVSAANPLAAARRLRY
jgi:hypothetical protein